MEQETQTPVSSFDRDHTLWFATQKKIAKWNSIVALHPKAGMTRHGGPAYARHDARGSGTIVKGTQNQNTRVPIWGSTFSGKGVSYFYW